jgi:hypothetical protein
MDEKTSHRVYDNDTMCQQCHIAPRMATTLQHCTLHVDAMTTWQPCHRCHVTTMHPTISTHNRMVTTDNVVDEVTEVIASCKEDMVALWSDPAVRTVLKSWNIHLEDSLGEFDQSSSTSS